MSNFQREIFNLINTLQITSAGGDSPKINQVLQTDTSIDLDSVLEDFVLRLIQQELKGQGKTGKGKASITAEDTETSGELKLRVQNLADDLLGGESTVSEIGKAKENVIKTFDAAGLQLGVGPAEMTNIMNFARNPTTQLLGVMKGAAFLGPFAAVVVAVLAFPAVMDKLIDLLTMPGGPFDKRLRIDFTKDMNSFFTRMEQRRRGIGLDQVVSTQFKGFGNMGGMLTQNTLNEVKATGISRLGVHEQSIGLVVP